MFNAKTTRVVAAPTSVAAGAATSVADLLSVTAAIVGSFTATYQLQACFDGSGTTFTNVGSAQTSAGNVTVPDGATHVRWNCTAYTSGTPTSGVGGVRSTL